MTGHGPGVRTALDASRPLATAFAAAGHRLFLVGGIVRDDRIGRHRDDADYDLTTDARPDRIKELVGPLAEAVWSQGERFGTIGCTIAGQEYEITTHRADTYDPDSRKPVVEFGDDVDEDLARRDFTINAMAIDVADGVLVDPFGGVDDLHAGRLRTPLDPEISFSDDPLRMVRAARFIATLGLAPDPALTAAVTGMRDRMAIVSVERVRDEFDKMLALPDPQPGFAFLSSTGLLREVLPAVAAAGLDHDAVGVRVAAINQAFDADGRAAARWAALLLDAPAADRGAALRALKPSGELASVVAWLLGADAWLDGRVPTDRPSLRRLASSAPAASSLEARLAFVGALRGGDDLDDAAVALTELRSAEPDLDAPRPPLSGQEVAQRLGVDPGPVIGEANAMLLEHRFEHGVSTREVAFDLLDRWWFDRA
ncbi:MAG: CCA tRNA nucleotidyltransferase [Actinomycetota bacterium]